MSSILILLAVICFAFAAFGFHPGRLDLVALGLAFWAGSALVGAGWPPSKP